MALEPWKVALEEVLSIDRLSDIDASFVEKVHRMVIEAVEWCSNPLVDEDVRRASCSRFVDILTKFLTTLERFRASKVLEGAEARGFDKKILRYVEEVLRAFSQVATFGLRALEGEVLCRVLKPIPLRKSIATPGFIVSIPLAEAAILTVLGFVKPVMIPVESISF